MKIKVYNILISMVIFLILIIMYLSYAFADIFTLKNKKSRLLGNNLYFTIPKNNKYPLEHFATKFKVGLSNLLEANPKIDVYLPVSGSRIIVPKKLILPDTIHNGIIINSPEMRLYFYPKKTNKVIVLPIAIGEFNKQTPTYWVTSIKYKKKILHGNQVIIYAKNIICKV